MHLVMFQRTIKQARIAFCLRDEAEGWQSGDSYFCSLSLMSIECVTLENSPSLSGPPFLTSKAEKTPEPQHGYWQVFMWDIEKKMKTQLGYTTASCSFQWCAMLSNRRWLSLFWTRWKSGFNTPQLFFFDSMNSHSLCLNPCEFSASTIFCAKDIHWMKKLFICLPRIYTEWRNFLYTTFFSFWMFFSSYNIHLLCIFFMTYMTLYILI